MKHLLVKWIVVVMMFAGTAQAQIERKVSPSTFINMGEYKPDLMFTHLFKDGRVVYTIDAKDNWTCRPIWTPDSNRLRGEVTAVMFTCVKAEEKTPTVPPKE